MLIAPAANAQVSAKKSRRRRVRRKRTMLPP
jgi:hypothetical protein